MQLCISAHELRNQLCTLALNGDIFRQELLSMNNEFKSEVRSQSVRACNGCGEKPALITSMLNPRNGRTVRMFKCACGEQTWSEDKK
jgi:hypothetical protein